MVLNGIENETTKIGAIDLLTPVVARAPSTLAALAPLPPLI